MGQLMLKHNLKNFSRQYDILYDKSKAYWLTDGFEETGRTEATRVCIMSDYILKRKSQVDILDLGCGRGRLANGLKHSRCKDILHYVGVDVNEYELQSCCHMAEENWEFHHYNMQNNMYNPSGAETSTVDFPYQENAFDIIYSWSVFSHLKPDDVDFYLNKFNTLLKPGGMIFLTFHVSDRCKENPTYNPDWWRYESGDKLEEDSSKLAVVMYHPGWVLERFKRHGFKVFFQHYPILASNYQTGYYLTK